MADEIERLEELIERAELRDVVVHQVTADRQSGPDPEAVGIAAAQLHAPGCPDDFGALTFSTRLADDELAVRCRIETRNAFGRFEVDAEAVFDLPAPISIRHVNVVGAFVEQVGAPAVFPYIRVAVASLAAQLSVAASPLPLLRPGDVALGIEESSSAKVPDGVAMQGTVEVTNDDGTVTHLLEFFYDAETGELVRFGDDAGVPPEVQQLLDSWAEIGPLQEMTWEWVVRNHGEDAAREMVDQVRDTEGDAAGDAAEAEVDRVLSEIEFESSATRLGAALEALHTAIGSSKQAVGDAEGSVDGDERGAFVALYTAAELVMHELAEFRLAGATDDEQDDGTAEVEPAL